MIQYNFNPNTGQQYWCGISFSSSLSAFLDVSYCSVFLCSSFSLSLGVFFQSEVVLFSPVSSAVLR